MLDGERLQQRVVRAHAGVILSRSVGARDYAAALREAKGRREGNSQEPPREFQKSMFTWVERMSWLPSRQLRMLST